MQGDSSAIQLLPFLQSAYCTGKTGWQTPLTRPEASHVGTGRMARTNRSSPIRGASRRRRGRCHRGRDSPSISLELDPTDSTARWGLIKLLLVRSDLDAAYRTFIDHPGELAVADAEQAKAWLAVHRREGLGEQLARGAVRLANQFPDDEGVVTAAVGAVLAPGPGRPDENEELDEELLAEVQGLVSFYLERWPDGAIKSISVDPEDPEGMLESIRQMVEVDPETARIRRSLQGRVARQELPLGVLASALHRSYTELLVKRGLGTLPASSPQPAEGLTAITGRTGTWFCCAR